MTVHVEPSAILLDLSSSESAVRAAALEEAILGSVGADASSVDVRRLGRVYRQLSEAVLATSETEGRSTGDLGSDSDELLDLVWGLVYGARSFQIISLILDSYGVHGSLVDLGGGWGPGALWSAVRGQDALVVERSKSRASFGRGLFDYLGLPVNWAIRAPARLDLRGIRLALWSYSLREMVSGPKEACSVVVESLQQMGPGSRAVVLESGARSGSSFVMKLRDELTHRPTVEVIAPCRASGLCPMEQIGDWCHFTWRLSIGPVGQRIAASAGRKAHEAHVSWLVIGLGRQAKTVGDRVIGVRERGKQGLVASLCSPEGLKTVEVPKKVAKQIPELGRDSSGSVVQVRVPEGQTRLTDCADWQTKTPI